MSTKSLAPALTKSKRLEATPEPTPTPLQHAEQTVRVPDFSLCEEKDPLRAVVAAEKTARTLQLAIGGLYAETEHSELQIEDIDLLADLASALSLICHQAKKLVAEHSLAAPAA